MIAKYLAYISLMMGLMVGSAMGKESIPSTGKTAPQNISKPALNSELPDELVQAILKDQTQSIVSSVSRLSSNATLLLTEQKVIAADSWPISVAISGDTAVFGSYVEDCAYIYVRSGGIWIYQTTLTPSDPLARMYGYSVAISNDTVLVSSLTTEIFEHNMGSVYVYTRSGTTWTEQGRLFASDGAEGDDFGITVSISGDTALVGAYKDDSSVVVDRGSAYVYVRNGTSWTEQAHLFASDGASGDYFGTSVALDGDIALIGARADDVTAVDQGSAYVFVRSGTSWIQQAQLVAQDAMESDYFGDSVAVDNDTALVGAWGDDNDQVLDLGSAYVYTRNGTVWIQQTKLTAPDGREHDSFGWSVALVGDTALIGAKRDDYYTYIERDFGSAYFFQRTEGIWNQLYKFIKPIESYSYFGNSVALSNNTALIGSEIGAAYFLKYSMPPGFYVFDGKIVDKNHNDFIIRGINYPFASFQDASYDHSFGDIKATGANTVRVVLHNGRYVEVKYVNGVEVDTPYVMTPIEKVGGVIGLCRDNHLVCVLEVHDTTGYYDYQYDDGSYHHRADSTLAQAVDYWKLLKDTLAGTEDFIIINIGNESYGNKDVRGGAVVAGWEADTVNAIHEMRAAGFKHMLMVDAPYWGKDTDPSSKKNVMKEFAASVFAEDPESNTVFSIHIYDEPLDFQSYISSYVNAGIPLVIGEFGYDLTVAHSRQNDIMTAAQSNGIGYLGWWWSSNGYELDMVQNFDPTRRTDWGKSIISGPNGICRTSVEASIFNGDPYPVICSITPINSNPTNAASVKFSVVFSEDVTGVDKTDFTLTTNGPTGASVNDVTGAGSTYLVTVTTGSGNGTLSLNAIDNDSILDLTSSNPLGGVGAGNGGFTFGEPYSLIDRFTFSTTSIGGQDGWILESTETSGLGGTENGSYTTFNVGDGVGDKQYRAILSFFTAGLPDNAVITRVTLKIKKQGQVGTNPFTILGGLKVSIRKPYFGTTIGLLVGDFQAVASRSAVGTFNTTPVSNWYSAIIGSAGYPYINLLDTTQFRLYFLKDDNDDMGADYIKFYSGNYVTASARPTLVVEYYTP